MSSKIFYIVLLCFITLTLPVMAKSGGTAWVLVDVNEHTLTVYDKGKLQEQFKNISLGRGGVGFSRQQGDGKTPLGQFQVSWVNRNSRYYLFFGLDFPNLDYAHRAFTTNLINATELAAITSAFNEHRQPPQNTKLGGYIGIHGVGQGDIEVHNRFNWTDGCVALTNQQIERLSQWVQIGTNVVIF